MENRGKALLGGKMILLFSLLALVGTGAGRSSFSEKVKMEKDFL